eukprot:CAMPEP_0177555024 /NCGR_PEP_ID=MMETSP0369-20130122/68294_1 /TAXON_ID=447022 ORGANISM="Scrippsiella hangoei-like, Strain SHHI-4" /NCGR_SAMPLE_ID=MMETSP0369 /ASSEMBLY_ACC=CAM_ASM_000364 /LENGTH=37 /DNA_ID= /DNA_START= /DNA_END= /DNA_ORIENTATION=
MPEESSWEQLWYWYAEDSSPTATTSTGPCVANHSRKT